MTLNQRWHLEWHHGSLAVYATGGMLGNVEFKHAGRLVRPFYEVPWLADAEAAGAQGLVAHMRSEFPCVPFGVPYRANQVDEAWHAALTTSAAQYDPAMDASDDLLHGYGAIGEWTLVSQSASEIRIAIDYPTSSAISRLTRVIRADLAAPAIDFELHIEARRTSARPLGLHPNIALPSLTGALRIDPGAFAFGMVHPGGPEPGVSRARAGAQFSRLDNVPLGAGGHAAFDRLPLADDTEEILQLCGMDGSVTMIDEVADVAYRLTWDAAVLPSLLLWISNRGRRYAPWNGRNLCVGVEPIAGAFELGCQASLAANPINAQGVATAVTLDPEAPVTLAYRFEVC
ncbi:hypothetical protein AB1286_32635 [Trinickia sp. NRRL B-1857]|uniref:hypothetical protein n=1 Tax=Trinickia sp. NRRL B-1857 TaxID=3162879 RepID=UPI003D284747